MSGYQETEKEKIVKYIPLVERIVGRMDFGDGDLDRDDLFSVGIIGLTDAIRKYDESKSVPFEAYATLRIKGTIIDELRKSGKVSRDRINKLNKYYRAKEELEQKLMREPDEAEIMEELGIGQKELYKLHETVHYLTSVSFESTVFSPEGNSVQLMDFIPDDKSPSPEDDFLSKERKSILTEAIQTLSEREQTLLSLYYVEELTLKEIAHIMGVSIPRVSQIHGKTLMKMRRYFTEKGHGTE
ncbi:MAG TPA: FliA/WhiG family RNA polymerase sigma factor [Eubacteriaceae bacterium]|nr:FliA/WhiG family RNA polymerase sigma factor [Eubacteriaceae bacterium]